MASVDFDAGRFPLVVLTYPSRPTAETITRLYADWDELLARGPHGVIIDLRSADPLHFTAPVRRMAAEQVERRRAAFEKSLIVEARVVSGVVVRGIVTAFDWIIGASFSRPLANFDDWGDAERFVARYLPVREASAGRPGTAGPASRRDRR